MESHQKGLAIAQEQDDIHRLLDIVEKDIDEGRNVDNSLPTIFLRVEILTGKKPTTIEEAREFVDEIL